MAKPRKRICSTCGDEDFTASSSAVCMRCFIDAKKQRKILAERKRILDCYGNVEGPTIDKFNHRCYTFTHSCGTNQTWSFSNLLRCWGRPHIKEPCVKCGGEARIKHAMAGYMEAHGRDWTDVDYANWEAYNRSVRKLTELTYRKHKLTINPLGLRRGTRTFHLDHKVPVIKCFEDGWPAEKAAALDNLQLLSAKANLAKGRWL